MRLTLASILLNETVNPNMNMSIVGVITCIVGTKEYRV